jgi:hypothetical protein
MMLCSEMMMDGGEMILAQALYRYLSYQMEGTRMMEMLSKQIYLDLARCFLRRRGRCRLFWYIPEVAKCFPVYP